MTIYSKYKAYYDYVSRRFGSDPDIVYVRSKLDPTAFETAYAALPDWKRRDLALRFDGHSQALYNFSHPSNWQRNKKLSPYFKVEYIVAGEYVLPIFYRYVRERRGVEVWEIVSPNSFQEELLEAQSEWARRSLNYLAEPNMGIDTPTLEGLIKMVGAPVFKIRSPRWGSLTVESEVPTLSEYKVPSRVSPEQMWQGIYQTLSNVLRGNPDKNPPVELDDKMKIQKAGFDVKTSFRGK